MLTKKERKELQELASITFHRAGGDPRVWDEIEKKYGVRVTTFIDDQGERRFYFALSREYGMKKPPAEKEGRDEEM